MRSRRLATSGDGMPEAGKVEAQAPGALAPPSVRFHSGTRKRRTQGIRVRPHPQAHRILPKHRGPVSRPFAPGCAAWGPCPAGHSRGGARAQPVLCGSDLEMQPACLCARGLSRKALQRRRERRGRGMEAERVGALREPCRGLPLSLFSRPGYRLWDHPAVPDSHLWSSRTEGVKGANPLEAESPSVMVGASHRQMGWGASWR